MNLCDWSSDVCSSDLDFGDEPQEVVPPQVAGAKPLVLELVDVLYEVRLLVVTEMEERSFVEHFGDVTDNLGADLEILWSGKVQSY